MTLSHAINPMSQSSSQPSASVILPVFNAGEYLDAAVESILNQSYADFELLLLDDGSTDGSLARMKKFAQRDPRCQVHTWPNRGLIATLNEGIRLSKGEILFRMDADDLSMPDRLKLQINYLSEHPGCVAVGARVMLIDPDGLEICQFVKELTHADIDAAHLAGRGGSLCHPAVAMRRSAVDKVQGYRDQFPHAEDIDLFLRLAEIGVLSNLPAVLLCYRQHPKSVGYQHASTQRGSAQRAVAEARRRRGLANVSTADPCRSDTMAPEITPLSEVHRKWAWWALAGGNIATARKHAFKALRLNPLGWEHWKLVACALRGH